MRVNTHEFRYALGLDVGIASVGWALLDFDRHCIIDLGVRCFDKAEDQDGESLNLARRMARLARRRYRHRRDRLQRLARVLEQHGLIDDWRALCRPPRRGDATPDPWRWRVEGLDRRLSPERWARVIYHVCKHRGFHWQSRAEEARQSKESKEGGKITAALSENRRLMAEKGYRTAAEMVLGEFPDRWRNAKDDYAKSLPRALLAEELGLLFDRQQALGNPHADQALRRIVLGDGDRKSGLLWEQKPALSGEDLLRMLGHCTFEKEEYRAPKASFTAERHVLLTRVNNLRLIEQGASRPLTDEERRIALDLPYRRKSDITYKALRTAWKRAGVNAGDFLFAGLRYPAEDDEKAKTPETNKFVSLTGWHGIRSQLENAGLMEAWKALSDAALNGRPEWMDDIAWVLSVYKEDDEARDALGRLGLPGGDAAIEALLGIRFDKFSNLSLKALRRILPHMEAGLRYDEACREAGYHHSAVAPAGSGGKQLRLPPFYTVKQGRLQLNTEMDLPRNPAVLRALNQARKVVNAIVREYGPPESVHIEMARDLSRPLAERRRIEREQAQYRERNEKDRQYFFEQFGRNPQGNEFAKLQLYREQDGKCAYSLEEMDVRRLLEPGYVEIDHVLPFSRSFDDSKNNKVLCLARENRNKGDRTPWEYMNGAAGGEKWRRFEAFVQANKKWRPGKKLRLLRKHFDEREAADFRERHLNDTRYICRFFKRFIEQHLLLRDEDDGQRRCVVVSGGLTALLRTRWGLRKSRTESDRHHALDAAVVAACGHWQVQQMNTYLKRQGWKANPEGTGYVNVFTGECLSAREFMEKDEVRRMFPMPWPHFRQELEVRLYEDDADALRNRLLALGCDEQVARMARPLFVSRAPKRRGGGALHGETIHSARRLDEGKVVMRVPLEKLTMAKLKNMVGRDDPRNRSLVQLLEDRLLAHGGDPKKAFAEPVFKPSAPGKKAPRVRSVKVEESRKSGFLVRGGVAALGEMSHVDVFHDGRRYMFVPRYPVSGDRMIGGAVSGNSAKFLFSLFKNDYIRLRFGNEWREGYVVMYESDGRLTLRAHDQPLPDKKYFRKSPAAADEIIRVHVDILGRTWPERRHGLA